MSLSPSSGVVKVRFVYEKIHLFMDKKIVYVREV